MGHIWCVNKCNVVSLFRYQQGISAASMELVLLPERQKFVLNKKRMCMQKRIRLLKKKNEIKFSQES